MYLIKFHQCKQATVWLFSHRVKKENNLQFGDNSFNMTESSINSYEMDPEVRLIFWSTLKMNFESEHN